MQSQIKVEGFDELFKAMDDLSEEIGKGKTDKIWKRALGYAIYPMYKDIRDNAPVDTGQLQDHIYFTVRRPQARDKASESYKGETFIARVTVGARRLDSKLHTRITKTGKERTEVVNRPVALAMEFGTAEDAPKPFIRKGLESNATETIKRLGQAIWYELEWGKWSKGKGK